MQLNTGARVAYAPEAIVYHKHRATLKTMAKQLQRQGFGEIVLDAMYKGHLSYRRNRRWQFKRMTSQVRALLTYVLSFVYRLLVCKARGKDRMYILSPLLWFVAESANIRGKLRGIWVTRFMAINPAEQRWEDPGER
jgi:hypothetical protein